MRVIFVILILSVFSVSSFCYAEPINTEILQIKMNRIYFASGEEENIFSDCPFFVVKSDDTLIQGYIEESYPGVSYSYPIENLSDTIYTESFNTFIQPATIDSLTPIIIGIPKLIPYGSSSNFPGLTSVTVSDNSSNNGLSKYGNILHTYLYDSETEMLLDFESGVIDAYISYKTEYFSPVNQTSVSTPAPFYVAMIPNISKPVNNKAFLTTSLYYRFNEKRISTLFDGTGIMSQNCLSAYSKGCKRLFEFNPENGRNLLNYLEKKPKKLFLKIQNESLEKIGSYFADILSRDRIRTKFTNDNDKADILFEFVPFLGNSDYVSLMHLHYLLKMQLPTDNDNKFLSNLDEYLRLSLISSRFDDITYYSRLAHRTLMEDIGIFPLIRPTIYCISNENLKGCGFDNNGHLDLSNLRKVVLPSRLAEINR